MFAAPSTGLYFTLNGVVYLPGDTVLITDIGATISGTPYPGLALVCNTTNVNTNCCRKSDNPPDGPALGDWYFPDGTVVPKGNVGTITRTVYTHQVRLSRRSNAMAPTGDYECRVPDENSGLIHTASIALGECSMIMPQG